MNKTILTIIALPALATVVNAQVSNGSFERFPIGTFYQIGNSSELGSVGISSVAASGWTAGSAAGHISGTTVDGSKAGWLNPNALLTKVPTATLSQSVTLGVGAYNLDFFSFTEKEAKSSTFTAAITGVGSYGFTETSNGAATARNALFEIKTAGIYNLVFTGTGNALTGSYSDTFIDGVSLKAVPEPSSTALLGLGALGLLVRRKR